MSNLYINRYAYPRQFLDDKPSHNLGIIVTMPCFNEPDLIYSLDSLRKCRKPESDVEIIVVINQGERSSEEINHQNLKSLEEAQAWAQKNNDAGFKTHIIYVDNLPQKHAGVGLARKIGMDEAVRRFETIGNKDGIIACFDADSTCDYNYLIELESHFQQNPETPGCSIYFEHPLNGENEEAIVHYELFLRYYVNALRFVGFPNAFPTIGSSIAVRSWAYQKQGGMNKRKAGEDFYFLQKIILLGDFTEVNGTIVIPSSRESDRVPFGTGRAMQNWQSNKNDLKETYNPKIFEDLKLFLDRIDILLQTLDFSIPESINDFLSGQNFTTEIHRIRKHSSNSTNFRKHFFQWFDGFRALKFVHFARDHFYGNVPIEEAVKWLFDKREISQDTLIGLKQQLLELRNHDRKHNPPQYP